MVESNIGTSRSDGRHRYNGEAHGTAPPWRDELATLLEGRPLIVLEPGKIVREPGERIDNIYVLQSGLVALLTGDDRATVETGTVGHGGFVGSSVVLGATTGKYHAVVLVTANAWRVPAEQFVAEYHRSPVLRRHVNRHLDWQLIQARQNALCHGVHSSEERFCRWLLRASDSIGSSEVPLTQGMCAQVLGLQRTTVASVAHTLQLAGLIRTRRGRIQITDQAALETRACMCWNRLRPYAEQAE
jgi:CRP-like cAMP-binding protein